MGTKSMSKAKVPPAGELQPFLGTKTFNAFSAYGHHFVALLQLGVVDAATAVLVHQGNQVRAADPRIDIEPRHLRLALSEGTADIVPIDDRNDQPCSGHKREGHSPRSELAGTRRANS